MILSWGIFHQKKASKVLLCDELEQWSRKDASWEIANALCFRHFFGCCLLTLDTLTTNSNTKLSKEFREKIINIIDINKTLKSLWTKLWPQQRCLHNKVTLSCYENEHKVNRVVNSMLWYHTSDHTLSLIKKMTNWPKWHERSQRFQY